MLSGMVSWEERSDWRIAQGINFVVFDCGEMKAVGSDEINWARPCRHRRRVASRRTLSSSPGPSSQFLNFLPKKVSGYHIGNGSFSWQEMLGLWTTKFRGFVRENPFNGREWV